VLTALPLLISACSTGSSSAGGGSDPTPAAIAPADGAAEPTGRTVSEPDVTATALAVTSQPKFKTWTVSGKNAEGVSINALVQLDPHLHTYAEVGSMGPRYADLLTTCDIDPQRDVIRVSEISLTAENNGFDTSVGVSMVFWDKEGPRLNTQGMERPAEVQFAVGYSDPTCASTRDGVPLFGVGAAVRADPNGGNSAQWGPVPILLVVKGYRSPKNPDKNPALDRGLKYAVFYIGDQGPWDPIMGGNTDVVADSGTERATVEGPGAVGNGLFQVD
jgi:hypothetical protein